MSTATVTILDDERLIREGETAVDAYNKDLSNARSRIMPMARGLLAAKRKHPATQDFGDWLQTSSYRELGKDDRAALIKIGEHELFAERFVRTTFLTSPETIWEAIRDLLPSSDDPKSPDPVPLPPQNDPTASTVPLASDSASPKPEQNPNPRRKHDLVSSGSDKLKDPSKAELVKILGIKPEQYAALMSAYPANRQRALKSEFSKLATMKRDSRLYFPGKKLATELFQIALTVVEAGKAPELSNHQAFDARVFLPDAPEAFCKHFTMKHLAARIDRIAPLDTKASVLKTMGASMVDVHAELHHLWEHGTNLPPKVAKTVSIPPEDSKNRIKHEVKFCGERIWPRDSLKHVTYEDMNTGWHLVDYWVKHLEHASPQKPKEVAVQLRHLIWDLQKASSITGLIDVMLTCMVGYSKRNDGKDTADLSDNAPPGLAR